VLLPGAPEPFDHSTVHPSLSTRDWVDLRKGIADTHAFQRLINAIKGIAPGPEVPITPQNDVCPYLGLRSFNEEHAPFFFGRESDIQRLLEKLKATRFLAVIGPSGSGKSSLVRAGLIPALRKSTLPGSESWTICVFVPRARPLTALATSLFTLFPDKAMQITLDQMSTDTRKLDRAVEQALVKRSMTDRVVMVVDQFEEIFTLGRDESERRQFLDNLLYASSIPEGRCVVVLTMRADFYPKCAAYPELSTRIASQQFLVSPINEKDMCQVIAEPARQVGLECEHGLAETILDEVANQSGALPLLEHALLELWRLRRGHMLTLEAYRETGGVKGAIAKRADEIYAAFNDEQKEITRRVLLRLTQPGEGTEDTKRRAAMNELITRSNESDAVESVVKELADARLLTTSGDEQTGERWVEVSHEALIRGWPLLQKWVDHDRIALRTRLDITEAAQKWQRMNRDESVLYRGVLLAQAQEWRKRYDVELNELERIFLNASLTLQICELEEEKARQQHELTQAQTLAKEQKQRADLESFARTRQRYFIITVVRQKIAL
jgi:hypothetical protein